nr:CpsD/CapB family tyrosine-protein kinase [Chloroflexota bacterium]
AWNLAAASAAAGTPTLLIEADLRRPGLNPWGSRRTAGLSGLLSQQRGFDQVIEDSGGLYGDGPRPTRNLDVIFAGPNPPNPDELIDSERMRDLLRVAERRYELVVIDTPPTSVVSDAIPLVQEVSGVLVIGRLGQTTREAAVRLASQLQNLQARVFGIVVNDAPRSEAAYYYDGYSFERPETETITPARP